MPAATQLAAAIAPGERARAGPQAWAEWGLILLLFFVAGGAPAPHVNETHYLAKAKHYWNPRYCPGDLFLDSADAHLVFYWTLGWLTKYCSLTAVAWIGRIAGWSLIAAGWLSLSRAILPRRWAAPAAALVWIVLLDKCDFSGEWVIGGLHGKGGVESKVFAYGCVMFGLAALARSRWTAPWIWFGAASAMHALVGGWAVLAAGGVALTEPRISRPSLRSLLPGLVIGGLLALPGLLPALALDRGAAASTAAEAARIYVFERLPHHLAPASLPVADFLSRSLRFGLLVLAFVWLARWADLARRHGSHDTTLAAGDAPTHLADLDGLDRIMRFATFALIGNCLGLAINIAGGRFPNTAAALLRYYWFRPADVTTPLAVALGAACFAGWLLRYGHAAGRLAVAAVVLLCSARLGRIVLDRWRHPVPPGVARMEHPEAWIAACEWIAAHAPPDAVCLVPRHAQSFKWYAQRADVGNWKDVPQDAASVVAWQRRMADLFPAVATPAGAQVLGSPEQWGARRALDAAQRYGATFIVARSEPPLGLREVFTAVSPETGEGYSVYAAAPRRQESPP